MGYLFADRGEYDLARTAFQAYRDWGLKRDPEFKNYYSAEHILRSGWVDLKQGRVDAAKARLKEIERPSFPKWKPACKKPSTRMYRLLEAEVFLAENLPEKAIEAGLKIVPENFRNMTCGDSNGL